MTDFRTLLVRLDHALGAGRTPYMVIGGQAVLVHGQPRLTEDIDVTLGVGPRELDRVLAVCGALGLEVLPEHPREFVQETFVLPTAEPESSIRVDFIFSTTPYEAAAIARADRIRVGASTVAFATAEDLILHKIFAGRPRDLEDVRGIVRRKGAELDWAYVRRWAQEFASLPGRESMVEVLEGLRDAR